MDSYKVEVTYGGTAPSERGSSVPSDVVLRQDTGGSEFERFEDLTRNLLTVTKSELDEKLKES